jgi:hypothetical protein
MAEWEKVTLKRLSLCPCGFRALRDEIGLGTEYQIARDKAAPFTFQCGGCGKKQHLVAVYVAERADAAAGYLPIKLFEDDPQKSITA